MGKSFAFELGAVVQIKVSGETGTIKGRAEYLDGEPNSYWIEYKASDGRAVTAWWPEKSLVQVSTTTYTTA